MKKTSLLENGLLWFGAAVSVAEIMTGTYLAPLGFQKGIIAIVIGHIFGFFLLFFSGILGGERGKSSMEATKMSFGQRGSYLFAFLNLLQLLGWTGIMIYDGAVAADGIFHTGKHIWAIMIGVLILLWILVGLANLGKLNMASVAGLFVLSVGLSVSVFQGEPVAWKAEALSFGAAVELSVAMPLSWLPLISDYTKEAKKPRAASLVSSIVYSLISCWMYIVGMGAAMITGESDIASILQKSGWGDAGLLIIVLSTVTTTFLDAYSAGVSVKTLWNRADVRAVAVVVTLLGTVGAMVLPLGNITSFLYFIGSVFAPMIAVQMTDVFVLKKNRENSLFDIKNLVLWLIGFLLYRGMMRIDFNLGSTLPAIGLTMLLCILANYKELLRRVRRKG